MSTQIVLQGQDTGIPTDLYMSFELGDKKWQLAVQFDNSPTQASAEL
jgi:hypothetical protein